MYFGMIIILLFIILLFLRFAIEIVPLPSEAGNGREKLFAKPQQWVCKKLVGFPNKSPKSRAASVRFPKEPQVSLRYA
jgi:hypothetical protein